MRVLAVASELYPVIKTGGLADVTGALPGALATEGMDVRTLLPGYPIVIGSLDRAICVHEEDIMGAPAKLMLGRAGAHTLLVLDAPHLYERMGTPYADRDGVDWPDNAQRFAALAHMGARIGQGLIPGWVPAVVHSHDWQAGLLPAYFAKGRRPGTVFTVHNLAFQGWFPPGLMNELGLPPAAYDVDGVEFYGGIGMLKAGLRLSDRITTVSPTYMTEIQTPEYGAGLDGLLRSRSGVLSGILNGIDRAQWDTARDKAITATYTAKTTGRRARNKAALQARMGLLPDAAALLFGVVSRLTEQKGMDLLLDALPTILAGGGQLAVLGTGDRAVMVRFAQAQADFPGRIGVMLAFDEAVAHQMQAGIDALLVPSRFEPCGLTQMCALRYGAVPVVARVGGLADTVIDANDAALSAGVATGVQFAPVDADGLAGALRRTFRLWAYPATWAAVQRNGMDADFGWSKPARAYAELYRAVAA